MRVVIETNRIRRMAEVWILRDAPDAVYLLREGRWETHSPDEPLPVPSMILPIDVLEALVAEGQGLVRHSDHVLDALADTRTVRDRLLALLELDANDRLSA